MNQDQVKGYSEQRKIEFTDLKKEEVNKLSKGISLGVGQTNKFVKEDL